jgi:hypothetical protein
MVYMDHFEEIQNELDLILESLEFEQYEDA